MMSRQGDGQADGLRFELVRVRKELRYNQALLAEILGVSHQYLSQMERGLKPLNQKALDLIRDVSDRKRGYSPTCEPESGGKVAKKALKTKEKRERFSVKLPVSDISGWWARKNPLCLNCAGACKQSARVKIICCPQYHAKEN